jgi:hypothetical protein
MKNSYAIVKNYMGKDEALWVESKLGLDSNGEFKSIHVSSKFGGPRQDQPKRYPSMGNLGQ